MTIELQDIYPLSPTQQGMLFHGLTAPASGMYVERLRYTIQGNLHVDAFARAWRELIRRHPVLRSAFVWEEVDEPLQVVLQRLEIPLERMDWRGQPPAHQETQLHAYLEGLLEHGFDLSQPPLMRLTLIQLADDLWEFIWSYHHLLLDGWSVSILLGELMAAYEAFTQQQTPRLENSPPYRNYIAWLQRQDPAQVESFWRQAMDGFTLPPSLGSNGVVGEAEYAHRHLVLSAETTARLDEFCRNYRLTPNTVVQGAWALLLASHTGVQDVVFGAVVSGRPAELPGSETMVGMFINTLPVRAQIAPHERLIPWLEALQAQQVDARQYEHAPLARIQEWSGTPRGQPLFESILVFENKTLGVRLGQQEGSPEIRFATHYATVTGYPLTLVAEPGADDLTLGIMYDCRHFDAAAVERMLGHLRTLLAAMLADPTQRLRDLSPLTPSERQQMLEEWNDTAVDYGADQTLHRRFEAQVEATPERIAVTCADEHLTYRGLNQRANRLAHHLRILGVGPDVLVGLYLERSLEMIVAFLGVLKAGGAYVPLDPSYPAERLAYMLADSAAPVILTQRALAETLPAHNANVVLVDGDWQDGSALPSTNPDDAADDANLAYVIYTSGSTGRPKGVMVPHRAITNHMLWLAEHFKLTADDCYLQKTPFSFDASGTEFYAPLLTGGRLVMARPGGHQESGYLVDMVRTHGVTVLQLVPSLLRVLLDEADFRRCDSLRRVICAGEALPAELQQRFYAQLPEAELHNFYGPTEAAIDVSVWPERHAADKAIVPIGRPIANTQLYVLDAQMQPAPVGAPGQLYIGGANLARGYLRRPDLSAERFVPHPFAADPGQRLYQTGDLARVLADGAIEFLGRVDHQVKLRGVRIELGEVEAALRRHDHVRDAVAVVREPAPGHQQLVAYVVTDDAALTPSQLRAHVAARLPETMTPARFVLLDRLPLTPNGKVDRRALPEPSSARDDVETSFAAPRNAVEETLAQIWAHLLAVDSVGVHDNFFELGGDSILSIQVVGKASQAGLRLTPRQIFQHPTIDELAEVVDNSPAVQAEQGPVTGAMPLTPVQHWFFEPNRHDPHHYNHAILLAVHQTLDPNLLEVALRRLVEHHDALRLRFTHSDEGWRQHIADAGAQAQFDYIDLRDLDADAQRAAIEEQCTQAQDSLDLAQGPLMRVLHFGLGDTQPDRLLLLIHHLAVDGVSWRILLDDLMAAYGQLRSGQRVHLPPKTTSYKAWAQKLVDHAQSPQVNAEAAYWLDASRRHVPSLSVDTAAPAAENTVAVAESVSISLSEESTHALLHEAQRAYRTGIEDLLLTALAQTLTTWLDTPTVLVDLESHGREAIFDDVDLSRTVGWFTAIYPMLLKRPRGMDTPSALKSIKEQLRKVPNGGVGYGLLRYLSHDDDLRSRLSTLPQAEVSFNYLGRFDQILAEDAPFAAAPEAVGPVHSPRDPRRYLLEIDGYVAGGRLHLEWKFSGKHFRRPTIEWIAANYLTALQALLDHVVSPDAGGVTPSDFPLAQLSQPALDALVGAGRDVDDIYPLTPVQEGMLFYSLFAPDSGAYVTQIVYELAGLDAAAMKAVWRRIVDRHPILRTAFVWQNLDQPLQVVYRDLALPFTEEDWQDLSPAQQEDHFLRFLQADQARGFILEQAPLMRMSLFRMDAQTYRLVWSYHHLLLDGWSVPLLTQEFLAAYHAQMNGESFQAERSLPYRSYVEWLHRQDLTAAESFWRRSLQGIHRPTALAFDAPANNGDAAAGYAERGALLDEATTAALQRFARGGRLTQNTLVQGAWALILHHYSGSEDVLFGATLAGRPAGLPGVERMIGLFINTLPVPVHLLEDGPAIEWLQTLQRWQTELRQHENSPLSAVQQWSHFPKDTPLFESIVVFENFPMNGDAVVQDRRQGMRFVNTDFIIRNNFPFTVRAVPGDQLSLRVLYDAVRFSAAAVDKILAQFQALLHAIATRPNADIADLKAVLAEVAQAYQRRQEESFKETRRQKLKEIRRKSVRSA